MWIPSDCQEIGKIDPEILNPVIDLFNRTDWNYHGYRRFDYPLLKERKGLVLPFIVYKFDHSFYTKEQVELIKAVEPVVEQVLRLFPGYIKVRGEITNLLPGVELGLHIDPAWFHKHSKRIHVPIITNQDCYHMFEDRKVHLEFSKIYEINNRIRHSAVNGGSTNRVHLILDLLDENLYNQIDRKLHILLGSSDG